MLLLLWCLRSLLLLVLHFLGRAVGLLRRREQVTHDVASQSKWSGGMVLLGCVLLRVCVGESRVEHAAHGVRCCRGLG